MCRNGSVARVGTVSERRNETLANIALSLFRWQQPGAMVVTGQNFRKKCVATVAGEQIYRAETAANVAVRSDWRKSTGTTVALLNMSGSKPDATDVIRF